MVGHWRLPRSPEKPPCRPVSCEFLARCASVSELHWSRRLRRIVAPAPLSVAALVLGFFMLVNLLVRLGLAVFNGDAVVWLPHKILPSC